jgi:hypothetical protein
MLTIYQDDQQQPIINTTGFLIVMTVTNASVQDRDGAKLLFTKILHACKRLKTV